MKKIRKYIEFINEEVSDDIFCEIYDTDRVINTDDEELVLFDADNDGRVHFKPTGLWYSMGTEWIDWCRSEQGNPEWERKNVFLLEVDDWNVLVLDTPEKRREFEREYGHSSDKFSRENKLINVIDWERVAEDYYGIEIHNPWGPIGHWLNPWDVGSGCIWDKRAIKRVEKLEE
jgi:hypothetical protein